MERPSHSSAPENQLLGSSTCTSGVQVEGPLKTTISPGSGLPNQYGTLLTSTRSPVQPVQPCRVCSMEPDGMKNAWTKKVLTTSARTNAISRSTGSSRSSDPFLASPEARRERRDRRDRREDVPWTAFSPGSPGSSPGTTSAGPPRPARLLPRDIQRGGRPAAATA